MAKAVDIELNPPTWNELCSTIRDKNNNKYSLREQLFTVLKQMEIPNYITTLKIYSKKDAPIPQISKLKWSSGDYQGHYKIFFRAHKIKLTVRNKEHGEECKDDCLGLMVTSSNEDHIHLSFPQEHVKLISEIAIHDSDGDIQVQLSGAEMLSQILP